jgi:hypothetical protein
MPTTNTRDIYPYIDSSLDQEVAWTTFGGRETGEQSMTESVWGATGFAGLAADPQAFHLFPTIDQRQIIEELNANPSFAPKLTAMLHHHDAARIVSASAKRAATNEMDGRSFPESKGEWLTLRKRLNLLVQDIPRAIEKQVSSMSPAQQNAALRAIAQGGRIDFQLGETEPAKPAGGGDIWGGIIGGIAQAAGSIFGAKITADAQKKVASIAAQTQAQQAAGAQQIAQQQALIDAARAKAAGGGGDIAGIPIWTIPLGLGVLGFILYMVFKK